MLVILFSGFYPSFSGGKDNLFNGTLKVFYTIFIGVFHALIVLLNSCIWQSI